MHVHALPLKKVSLDVHVVKHFTMSVLLVFSPPSVTVDVKAVQVSACIDQGKHEVLLQTR